MGASDSKSDESKGENAGFNKSNLFLLNTLFNVDTVRPDILEKYKEALILFTVLHGHVTAQGVKIFGPSFRYKQMATKTDLSIFDFILKSILQRKSLESTPSHVLYSETFEDNVLDVTFDSLDTRTSLACQFSPSFVTKIIDWKNSDFQIGIFAVFQQERDMQDETGGHATVLVLYKTDTELTPFKFFYFDPHGGLSRTTIGFIETQLKQMLSPNLKWIMVSISCPAFQTSGQGGNCVHWAQLFLLCLLTNPSLLAAPEQVEHLLGASPDVNIMIYELFVFFIGMATVPQYVNHILSAEVTDEFISPSFNNMLETSHGIGNCQDRRRLRRQKRCERVKHCVFFEKMCWSKAINIRFNLFKKLALLYQQFAAEHFLPWDSSSQLNVGTSYTPEDWEVEEAEALYDPDRFWTVSEETSSTVEDTPSLVSIGKRKRK